MAYCSGKKYVELLIKDKEASMNRVNAKKSGIMEQQDNLNSVANNIKTLKENRISLEGKYRKFTKELKESLISECIMSLYNKSLGVQLENAHQDAIKRNLVNQFVEENGADNLLRSFKKNSFLLAEYARISEKYYNIVIEGCDKKNENTFIMDPADKDDFYADLEIPESDEVASVIKLRVSSAINHFNDAYQTDRAEIKNILQDSQEKIQSADSESMKESYELAAKRKINSVRNKRVQNVFENMVIKTAKAAMDNDNAKNVYLNESGKLDMDTIVDNCSIMYTFLEVLNTAKIQKIDESYITNLLDNFS